MFILFLIPGTPKDLLTYVVGLTPMKLTAFLLITTLARIPSVVSSTVTGSLAQKGSYTAAVVTFGVTLIVTVICVMWYRRISKQEKQQAPAEQSEEKQPAGQPKQEAQKNKNSRKNGKRRKG